MQQPTKLLFAEHAVVTFFHSPAVGVNIKDMLEPSYWAHVARDLRPGHKIEVLAEDMSYWAMLMVRDVGRTEAKVVVLQEKKLDAGVDLAKDVDDGLEIKWRGPSAKFSVVRKDGGDILRDGFQTRDAASQWRANRNKNMAA